MKLNEVLKSKEFLESENEKFNARSGKYTYKVKNQAKDIAESIKFHRKGYEYTIEETGKRNSKTEQDLKYCEEELLPLAERLLSFRSFQETDLWNLMRAITTSKDTYRAWYYDCLELVNMINAYWDITGEKPANRIAWGWEKCREKDNPQAYLYGCIRNYLKRNGKFDKDEFNKIWTGRIE